jgi:gas vesicle protein
MKGRFLTGIAAGALIGAAAGMMMVPQMNHKNKRRTARASNRVVHDAMNIIGGLKDLVR